MITLVPGSIIVGFATGWALARYAPGVLLERARTPYLQGRASAPSAAIYTCRPVS